MICPVCESNATDCVDFRPMRAGRRRRYLCACGAFFTTIETVSHVGDQRRTEIAPEDIHQWRQETINEIEAALDRVRRKFGLTTKDATP